MHKDTLKLLFPAELGDTFADDIELEGDALDVAEASADTLLANVFADTAEVLLPDWERVLGLTPETDASTLSRQNACVAKLREQGGLSIAYFTQLALNYGYGITIAEFRPFQVGIGKMGDTLYIPGIVFCWEVTVTYSVNPSITATELEARFQDLKPADTHVSFVWPSVNIARFRRTCLPDYFHPHVCNAATWDSQIRVEPIEVV